MNNLEAALSYAARGWPVLPIKPGTKVPDGMLTPRGVLDATTDPILIESWFAMRLDEGVAIATGAPGPDVLDIDDPEAAPPEVFDDLLGPWVVTGRGEHRYFTGSDGRTIKLPYGELRRKGSYVIAPPTVHPTTGQAYRWLAQDAPLVAAPDWIAAGRSTAGAGQAPVVDRVAPGAMYDHLLDLSVRLARAGMLDQAARERALHAEFEARRIPGADYGDPEQGARDTARLAGAPSDIVDREAAKRTTATSPPTGGDGAAAELLFQTPEQLRANIAPEPGWLWEGSMAEGFITIVGGRPKVGKSTIVYEAVDRIVKGTPDFLGSKLTQTDVVVISEEHAVTALNKLADSPRLHVLTRDAAWPLPTWPALIAAARAEALRHGARLLLIDSFTFWAQLGAEAAQDAGSVQEAVNALVEVAREGIAVVLIHHQRKGGGEFGDALLGSTAFAANADIILEVERMDDTAPPSYRRINRVGRWYVPPVLIAAWTRDDGYALIATADSINDAEDVVWTGRIREMLRPYGSQHRQTELVEQLGGDGRKWGRAMAELIADGEVVRSGAGGQKDPIEFTLVAPDDRRDQPAI